MTLTGWSPTEALSLFAVSSLSSLSTAGGTHVTRTRHRSQVPARHGTARAHHKAEGTDDLRDRSPRLHWLQWKVGVLEVVLAATSRPPPPTGNTRPLGRNRYPMRSEAFWRPGCKSTFYWLEPYGRTVLSTTLPDGHQQVQWGKCFFKPIKTFLCWRCVNKEHCFFNIKFV